AVAVAVADADVALRDARRLAPRPRCRVSAKAPAQNPPRMYRPRTWKLGVPALPRRAAVTKAAVRTTAVTKAAARTTAVTKAVARRIAARSLAKTRPAATQRISSFRC